jgi:hypothetical protein
VCDDPDRLRRDAFLDVSGRDETRCDHRTGVLEVPIDAVDDSGDLVARLPDGLPHLARRERGALVGFGRKEVAKGAQRRGSFGVGTCRPARLCAACPRELLADLALLGDGHRTHDVSGRGITHLD